MLVQTAGLRINVGLAAFDVVLDVLLFASCKLPELRRNNIFPTSPPIHSTYIASQFHQGDEDIRPWAMAMTMAMAPVALSLLKPTNKKPKSFPKLFKFQDSLNNIIEESYNDLNLDGYSNGVDNDYDDDDEDDYDKYNYTEFEE
ncbi:unnamed protein product [Ambrosiozyma monospora]|uniref:Unnamed protein product n=1 Tax=Ambrosiozyma monospora TaxID=43982 RepID=A0A9W6YSC6_AMBMO|nr:unnamed protein product [Ambrosiozyma monospora]